jgi:hypothetical protein
MKKLNMLGVTIDLVDYDLGAYDHYKEETGKISMVKLKQHFNLNIS